MEYCYERTSSTFDQRKSGAFKVTPKAIVMLGCSTLRGWSGYAFQPCDISLQLLHGTLTKVPTEKSTSSFLIFDKSFHIRYLLCGELKWLKCRYYGYICLLSWMPARNLYASGICVQWPFTSTLRPAFTFTSTLRYVRSVLMSKGTQTLRTPRTYQDCSTHLEYWTECYRRLPAPLLL